MILYHIVNNTYICDHSIATQCDESRTRKVHSQRGRASYSHRTAFVHSSTLSNLIILSLTFSVRLFNCLSFSSTRSRMLVTASHCKQIGISAELCMNKLI